MNNNITVGSKVKYLGEHELKNEHVHVLRNAVHDKLDMTTVYEIAEVSDINTYPYRLKGKNYYHPASIFKVVPIIDKKLIMSSSYDDSDLDKAPIKPIIINPSESNEPIEYSEIDNNLFTIFNKDLNFYCEIEKLIKYLNSTYSDKYEGDSGAIKSKNILLSKEGKSANMFTAIKYIQRYSTSGYSKSENIEDLYKSIHYLLFELQRKTKHA